MNWAPHDKPIVGALFPGSRRTGIVDVLSTTSFAVLSSLASAWAALFVTRRPVR